MSGVRLLLLEDAGGRCGSRVLRIWYRLAGSVLAHFGYSSIGAEAAA